jgi:hypothetical protein
VVSAILMQLPRAVRDRHRDLLPLVDGAIEAAREASARRGAFAQVRDLAREVRDARRHIEEQGQDALASVIDTLRRGSSAPRSG